MIWLALLGSLTGAIIVLGKNLLYPLTRLEQWDSTQWPIQFTNGISFIYDQPDSNTIILFSHGNFGNLTDRSLIRQICRSQGWGLILYDYYGYGASSYIPNMTINEGTLQSSIWEIYKFLQNRGKRIILMGESLGCYPTCWLATQNFPDIAGVILCVPFDKLSTVAGVVFRSPLMGKICGYPMGYYDNTELCKDIRTPTIIIRAAHDEMMPLRCGDCIAEGSRAIREIYTVDTDHNGYLNSETLEIMKNFISSV